MQESVKYIIGNVPIPLTEIPELSKKRNRYTGPRKAGSSPPPPLAATKTLYGIKIQPLAGLGEKADKQAMWKAVLGALQVGQGFEVQKKDFGKMRNMVPKFNKNAKAIWRANRKFVFERGVNAQGEPDATVGRVGRIQ